MKNSKQVTCPRCGGNGEVEHTHVMFGICFMCKGSGMVYPQRVEELTEKAAKRKAKKEAKSIAKAVKIREDSNARFEAYYTWQYNENLIAFHNKINDKNDVEITGTVATELIKDMQDFADYKNFNKNTSEETVRKFIKRMYKAHTHNFRYAISKWTLENFGFIFITIHKDDAMEGAKGQYEYEDFNKQK
jgi:hypothetical protein